MINKLRIGKKLHIVYMMNKNILLFLLLTLCCLSASAQYEYSSRVTRETDANKSKATSLRVQSDRVDLYGTYVDGKKEGKFLKLSKNGRSEVVTFSNGEHVTEWY